MAVDEVGEMEEGETGKRVGELRGVAVTKHDSDTMGDFVLVNELASVGM